MIARSPVKPLYSRRHLSFYEIAALVDAEGAPSAALFDD
jgi:hypothetical protein